MTGVVCLNMEIRVQHNPKTYKFLLNSKARTNILYGSAGSGKSWSLAQYLLFEKMYKEKDIRILVVKKTMPALRKSALLLINDLLSKYKLPGYEINKSELVIRANGNEMYFTSIDDPEKLKSFEKINYIWSEESTDLTKNDYMQLDLRCRGKNVNGPNQLFFSFNPIDEMSFFKPITENPPKGTVIHHSTYKDNEFNEPEYVETLERLIDQDETYHKIYCLGLWATPTNIIYTRWDVTEFPKRYDDIYWGLDFGYSAHPSALVEMRMIAGVDEVWERERLYQTSLTNPELIDKLKGIIENRNQMIIADCAEPKSIQEIKNAGFNIFPCQKGKDSVRFGINSVKSVMTHITPDSANLIKEKRSYKWKVDKDGVVQPEPVKLNDHLLDAERYVLMKLKGKIKAGLVIPQEEHKEPTERDLIMSDEMWAAA